MRKLYLAVLAAVVVIVLGYFFYRIDLLKKSEKLTPIIPPVSTSTVPNLSVATTTESDIRVSSPKAGDIIKSPFLVLGEARGTWFFEASFPMKLVNASGRVIAETQAVAQGEWMTEKFVPFMAKLVFIATTSESGELVLRKDNPSGLPENDKDIRIPVKIQVGQTGGNTVN